MKGHKHEPMKGSDLMPWGKYEEQPMEDIPLDYLKWLLEQDWIDKWPHIKAYAAQCVEAAPPEPPPPEEGPDPSSYQDYLDEI